MQKTKADPITPERLCNIKSGDELIDLVHNTDDLTANFRYLHGVEK